MGMYIDSLLYSEYSLILREIILFMLSNYIQLDQY